MYSPLVSEGKGMIRMRRRTPIRGRWRPPLGGRGGPTGITVAKVLGLAADGRSGYTSTGINNYFRRT